LHFYQTKNNLVNPRLLLDDRRLNSISNKTAVHAVYRETAACGVASLSAGC